MKYKVGEEVTITSGKYKDRTGTLIKIEDGIAYISGDITIPVNLIKRVVKRGKFKM
jgi:transcription antitermination factor NusG